MCFEIVCVSVCVWWGGHAYVHACVCLCRHPFRSLLKNELPLCCSRWRFHVWFALSWVSLSVLFNHWSADQAWLCLVVSKLLPEVYVLWFVNLLLFLLHWLSQTHTPTHAHAHTATRSCMHTPHALLTIVVLPIKILWTCDRWCCSAQIFLV